MVIDPKSLKVEGTAKLYCGEVFSAPISQSLNRQYPLLTDGENLFIVTMQVTKKSRKLKKGNEEIYKKLQEHKKSEKEEADKLTKKESELSKLEALKRKKLPDKGDPEEKEKLLRELKRAKMKAVKAEKKK